MHLEWSVNSSHSQQMLRDVVCHLPTSSHVPFSNHTALLSGPGAQWAFPLRCISCIAFFLPINVSSLPFAWLRPCPNSGSHPQKGLHSTPCLSKPCSLIHQSTLFSFYGTSPALIDIFICAIIHLVCVLDGKLVK